MPKLEQNLYPNPDFFYQNPRSHVIWLVSRDVLIHTFRVLDSKTQEEASSSIDRLSQLSEALSYLGIEPHMHSFLGMNPPPGRLWHSDDPVKIAEHIAGSLVARVKRGVPTQEREVRITLAEFITDYASGRETYFKMILGELPTKLQNWMEEVYFTILDAEHFGFSDKALDNLIKSSSQ